MKTFLRRKTLDLAMENTSEILYPYTLSATPLSVFGPLGFGVIEGIGVALALSSKHVIGIQAFPSSSYLLLLFSCGFFSGLGSRPGSNFQCPHIWAWPLAVSTLYCPLIVFSLSHGNLPHPTKSTSPTVLYS
jgi:hypothetical protein